MDHAGEQPVVLHEVKGLITADGADGRRPIDHRRVIEGVAQSQGPANLPEIRRLTTNDAIGVGLVVELLNGRPHQVVPGAMSGNWVAKRSGMEMSSASCRATTS